MSGDTGIILAAGGMGRRFGGLKQFLTLADRPIIEYSLDAIAVLDDVAEVVVVLPASHLKEGQRVIDGWRARRRSCDLEFTLAEGGLRRQDSVLRGLESLTTSPRYALIHDAARPLITSAEIAAVLSACRTSGSAVLATACSDSLKRVVDGVIVEEVPRDGLWAVQTPQGAETRILLDAFTRHGDADWTDDVSMLRAAGAASVAVEGSRENIKITSPGDQRLAEAILRSRV